MPETVVRPFKPGDRVHVKPDFYGAPAGTLGRTYVVRKVNPKNVQADSADGGRGINFPAYALAHGDAPAGNPYAAAVTALAEMLDVGQVVTLKRAMPDTPEDLPYVVTKDDGRGKVNLVRLGGDGGRYVRAASAAVVKRDLAWLAAHLAS